MGAEGTGWLGGASNRVTRAWASATPAGIDELDEALAEAEVLGAAELLEAAEWLELLLEEQAASRAAAAIAAAGAAKRFHVRVMLTIPPSTGYGARP